jgi:hypothetical protein
MQASYRNRADPGHTMLTWQRQVRDRFVGSEGRGGQEVDSAGLRALKELGTRLGPRLKSSAEGTGRRVQPVR